MRIVDIVDHLPVHATKQFSTRHKWAIRKILVHHHAGSPKGTAKKEASGTYKGVPTSCVLTANFFVGEDDPNTKGAEGKEWPGYAYNYDIGYDADIEAGRDYIYRTQADNVQSWHTGAGQNEMGIAISHFGSLREQDHLTGQFKTPNDGKPSDFQKRCFPAAVEYLQTKYKVSDLHVQGHFQHKKPACPGWDTEFWIMHREERPRREKRAFCWPVNPGDPNKALFFGAGSKKDIDTAKDYMTNTFDGGSGLYPFSRTLLWHDGVHLFSGSASKAFCIRDGWVVAARFDKTVKVKDSTGTEIDYGSANFVLVLHEDPGLYDMLDNRTYGENNSPYPLKYLSLYMHLGKLDETIPWVKLLKERDPDRWTKIQAAPDKVYNLSGIALPVRAGDQLGVMGKHNPFAARPTTAPAPAKQAVYDNAKNKYVMHFEIFSETNLLEKFDPDKKLAGSWTITDADKNAAAEDIVKKLDKLEGVQDADTKAFNDAAAAADKADPGQQDASAWTNNLTKGILNTLSKVVAKHASEWNADWDSIINKRFKTWGLDNAGKEHLKKVIAGFKWYKDAYKNDGIHTAKLTGLPATGIVFHYHPVRMLMWLGHLTRTLDHQPTGGVDSSGYPISTNVYADIPTSTICKAAVPAGTKAVALPNNLPEDRLKGSSIRFTGHTGVYEIESYSQKMNGKTFVEWSVTLKQGVAKDVAKASKAKIGNYGWHFEAGFAWATDLV